MSSLSRSVQLAVLVAVNAIGASAGGTWREVAMPSQTAPVMEELEGGMGLPIYDAMPTPTPPPSLELVKRRLQARVLAETNTCAEWTILGGISEDNGQPVCSSSQTCIFSTVGNLRYEGCGKQNVNYDWITECHDYPTTSPTGASQLHCPSTLPSCAVFEFVFSPGITYSNFGCGESKYTLVATLVDKTGVAPAIEPKKTSTTADALQPTNTSKAGGSATSLPNNNVTKSPLGLYVGVAVGGAVVLAIIGFAIWYCLRKRKRQREEREKAAVAGAEVAYHNQTYTAEMEGSAVGKSGFGSPQAGFYAPRKVGEGVDSPSAVSPPPVYGHMGTRHYGELEGRERGPSELENRPTTAGRVEIGDGVVPTREVQRPAVARQRGQQQQHRDMDMNGAPTSSDWRPQ